MSGMKNYLVKHGEREFDGQVEKERGKVSEKKKGLDFNCDLMIQIFYGFKYSELFELNFSEVGRFRVDYLQSLSIFQNCHELVILKIDFDFCSFEGGVHHSQS